MRTAIVLALAAAVGGMVGCIDPSQTERGEYTILLKAFSGLRHVEDAVHYRRETEQRTKWRGLYVVHGDNRSELFWGKYVAIKEAGPNLWTAKEWQAPNGENIYAMAIVVPIPGEDIGPPEWNLRNAKGKYTVAVAKYYNMPAQGLIPAYTRRREDAVAYCKELRDSGVEAHFLHEAAKSLVTVGTFPEGAIVSAGPGQELVGAIRDKRMQEILRKYPKLRVNAPGVYEYVYLPNPKTGKKDRIVTVSFPVEIPQREGSFGEPAFHSPGYGEPR